MRHNSFPKVSFHPDFEVSSKGLAFSQGAGTAQLGWECPILVPFPLPGIAGLLQHSVLLPGGSSEKSNSALRDRNQF